MCKAACFVLGLSLRSLLFVVFGHSHRSHLLLDLWPKRVSVLVEGQHDCEAPSALVLPLKPWDEEVCVLGGGIKRWDGEVRASC